MLKGNRNQSISKQQNK